MLRSGALRDPEVIAYVNREVVPVWINVRRKAIPDVPALHKVLIVGRLRDDRRVVDPFNRGFYLRSAVVSPDGNRLLNPQPEKMWGSVGNYWAKGHYSYAQTDPGDYLSMLMRALDRFAFCRDHPLAGCG